MTLVPALLAVAFAAQALPAPEQYQLDACERDWKLKAEKEDPVKLRAGTDHFLAYQSRTEFLKKFVALGYPVDQVRDATQVGLFGNPVETVCALRVIIDACEKPADPAVKCTRYIPSVTELNAMNLRGNKKARPHADYFDGFSLSQGDYYISKKRTAEEVKLKGLNRSYGIPIVGRLNDGEPEFDEGSSTGIWNEANRQMKAKDQKAHEAANP